jgi:glycosyltransferase involved in cell wall biosynthesis
MTTALVSIAMPVYNCADTIDVAVRSMLMQTHRAWELILIDDGSTDGTWERVARFRDDRIRTIRDGQNKGLPARLNEAMAMARGDYIARMDGDDVSYPGRLAAQVAYLDSHLDVDLVGGAMLVFGDQGRVLGKRSALEHHHAIARRPYAGFGMAHPTFFGRTAWFRSWRFNPEAGGSCDQDLLLRSHASSTFANLPDIVLGYREAAVALRKTLQYRLKFARSLVTHYGSAHPFSVARGLALTATMSVVDVLAVTTGLQHRLLRHRARPADPGDVAAWAEVWRQVTAADRAT